MLGVRCGGVFGAPGCAAATAKCQAAPRGPRYTVSRPRGRILPANRRATDKHGHSTRPLTGARHRGRVDAGWTRYRMAKRPPDRVEARCRTILGSLGVNQDAMPREGRL
jgi:hypothetical protein